MPFAHCTACGDTAMIDPSGRCPEGHEVGANGTRLDTAIGSGTPHPDEPTPWVALVDVDPEPAPVLSTRTTHPSSVAPRPFAAGVDAPSATSAAADDVFRELHALGDLSDLDDVSDLGRPASATAPVDEPSSWVDEPASWVDERSSWVDEPSGWVDETPTPEILEPTTPVVRRPAPSAASPPPLVPPIELVTPEPATPTARLAVTPGSPTPPSSPEEATDLDELASLVAAIGSLDDRAASAEVRGPVEESAPDAPSADAPTAAPAPDDEVASPPTATARPADRSPIEDRPVAADGAVERATPTVEIEVRDAPEPAAPVEDEPEALARPVTSPFAGTFTARGSAGGKRARKGLFRR